MISFQRVLRDELHLGRVCASVSFGCWMSGFFAVMVKQLLAELLKLMVGAL